MSASIEVINDQIPLLLERLPAATRELQRETAARLKEILQQLAPVGHGPAHDRRVAAGTDFKTGIQVDDGGPDDTFVVFTAPHSFYVLFVLPRPIHIEGLQLIQPWYLNEIGRLLERAGVR